MTDTRLGTGNEGPGSLSERLERVESFPSELRGVELLSWLLFSADDFLDDFGGGLGGCSAAWFFDDL